MALFTELVEVTFIQKHSEYITKIKWPCSTIYRFKVFKNVKYKQHT